MVSDVSVQPIILMGRRYGSSAFPFKISRLIKEVEKTRIAIIEHVLKVNML